MDLWREKSQTLLQQVRNVLIASLGDMERHPAARLVNKSGVVQDVDGFTHDLPALQCLPLLQAGARRGQKVERQEEQLIFTARFQLYKMQREERFGQMELFDKSAEAKTW